MSGEWAPIIRRFAAQTAWLGLALGLLAAANAWADGDTPLELGGANVVDVAAVARLAASGARIVDTRALHDFLAGHLPDAAHVDYKERSARNPGFDPRDDDVPAFLLRLQRFAGKDRPVVFYCNGPSCWKSYKAAAAASRAGYRQVYWFRNGFSAWLQDGRPSVHE
jgi:rhodanese-related sulfurtransferase